jgi:hypothetical protein
MQKLKKFAYNLLSLLRSIILMPIFVKIIYRETMKTVKQVSDMLTALNIRHDIVHSEKCMITKHGETKQCLEVTFKFYCIYQYTTSRNLIAQMTGAAIERHCNTLQCRAYFHIERMPRWRYKMLKAIALLVHNVK